MSICERQLFNEVFRQSARTTYMSSHPRPLQQVFTCLGSGEVQKRNELRPVPKSEQNPCRNGRERAFSNPWVDSPNSNIIHYYGSLEDFRYGHPTTHIISAHDLDHRKYIWSWSLELIFGGLVVLVSTSKLCNMSSKLQLQICFW